MAKDTEGESPVSVWTGVAVGFFLGCAAGAAVYHVAKPKVELAHERLVERREVAALLAEEQKQRQAVLAAQVRGRRDQQRLSAAQQRELRFQARLPRAA